MVQILELNHIMLSAGNYKRYFVFTWSGDNTDAVQILLAAGADLNHRNKHG